MGASIPKPIQLLLADVDGTLVTQEKVLTPRAIQAVNSLRDAGVKFAITSGRPPRGMAMLVNPLQLSEPVAGFNGGVVTQPDLISVLGVNLVEKTIAQKIIPIILDHKLDIWVYSDKEWYIRDPQAPHVAREEWTVKFPPSVVASFDSLLDRVAKIVGVSDDLEAVRRCEMDAAEACGATASVARSQPYYLDVTSPKANKGEVVLMLSKLLNIPTDEIATIGDMPNDVLMFRKSGVSIAMGNASKEVQQTATYVTSSNQDEGFANAVEQFVLKRTAAK